MYGVADRMELRAGDMFADPLPAGCDAVLLSNILHDWDEPECERLVGRCAGSLQPGGQLLIHDVFLNETMTVHFRSRCIPRPCFGYGGTGLQRCRIPEVACHCGLSPQPIVPTLIHCGALQPLQQSKLSS